MNNRNLRILKWALLLLVPLAIFAVMLPIARERRKVALTQELIEEAHTLARLERMRELVGQGADANGKLPNWDVAMKGSTALHFLAIKGSIDQNPKMLFLLSHGANIDARNEYGWTPLMLAASAGAVTSVRFLVDNGAQVNLRTPPQSFIVDTRGIKKRTALGFAQVDLQSKRAKLRSGKIPQLKETIRILKAAGGKE